MNLFVDTSVWSLAMRRDAPPDTPEVRGLRNALGGRETIHTTGLVLQELLQGFAGPKMRAAILETFMSITMLNPTRADHIEAAELKNVCRRNGIQIDTVDALLAQMCIHRNLSMLTTDRDFHRVASKFALKLWRPPN